MATSGKLNEQRPISCQVVALSFQYVLSLNQIYLTNNKLCTVR